MSDVHGGGHLNIAAMDALDSKDGCFIDHIKPPLRVVENPGGVDICFRVPYAAYSDVSSSP
jgi:hypothetical protein